MRGDQQWFDDLIAESELATYFEYAMFGMGLDVRVDASFAAWFHFNSKARFAYKPAWMHETFKDYGGYQAYIEDCEA